MPLPDFLVVGAPKAGTTALHAALVRHPQLYLSAVKEPKFFLSDGPPDRPHGPGDIQTSQEHIWRRADYERLFEPAPAGTLRGEATPFYLHDRAAQKRIKALVPDVRLIAVIRDPVDRAHSNWAHLWGAGLESERDVVAAVAREPERIAAGWAPFWHYADLGRYGEQLRDLYALFDRSQVLVMRYRDLRNTPRAALDRVCEFLGVRTGVLDLAPAENVSPRVADTGINAVLRTLLRSGAGFGHHFPLPVRQLARGPLLTALHAGRGQRPRLRPDERAALLPLFADDVHLLAEVTGESFDDWLDTAVPERPPLR